ncbi:hypothetical protein EVAR_41175_1 [Eumeta japonica]|uniref:Uncharacterized protein n=1 Tax=Eumeta variegata TaxID=151549 RepID=A0A4C1YER6_EUMVA|nr:hypothetical protein EVAR_41175_1 [Eumeta japonica]
MDVTSKLKENSGTSKEAHRLLDLINDIDYRLQQARKTYQILHAQAAKSQTRHPRSRSPVTDKSYVKEGGRRPRPAARRRRPPTSAVIARRINYSNPPDRISRQTTSDTALSHGGSPSVCRRWCLEVRRATARDRILPNDFARSIKAADDRTRKRHEKIRGKTGTPILVHKLSYSTAQKPDNITRKAKIFGIGKLLVMTLKQES